MRRNRCRLMAAAALLCACASRAQAETVNRIVALVNEDVITDGDVNLQMTSFLKQEEAPALGHQESTQVRQAILQRLIQERLIVQEAKRMGLSVSLDEVLDRLAKIRVRFPDEAAYEAMLRDSGLSEEQLKQKLQEQALVQQAIDRKVRSRIVITPQELAQAARTASADTSGAEQARAYHLLIRVTDARQAGEAKALADQLCQQLRSGADPAELAKRYSEDPHTEGGGLMDWVGRGELIPELDEVLFRLQPGEVSDPIKTSLGVHLLKLVERKEARVMDSAERQLQAQEQLYNEKFTQLMTAWLNELGERAYIHVSE